MRYHFYPTAEKAWSAMLDAVKTAEQSIYWESFSLYEDKDTYEFLNALKEKVRQGIRVRGVVDSLGGFWASSKTINDLRAAGIEILFFNRLIPWWNRFRFRRWWFLRTHRKILIIDEKIVFTGGVNIGVWYGKWIDLQVRLTGVIVCHFLKTFAKVYEICGGQDENILKWVKHRKKFPRLKVWLLEHWPIKGKSVLRRYYKNRISSAKRNILIVTPYFAPHRWLEKLLIKAVKRGARVEIILPFKTDAWLANMPNYVFADLLSQEGVRFFFTKEMIHAKVLLIDDREGMVGSNNIDAQSFNYNVETSVVFRRKDIVGDLRRIIENWKKIAQPADFTKQRERWYYPLVVFVAKLLQPIL